MDTPRQASVWPVSSFAHLASGTVVAVSLRTTTVRAADGGIWHVRNGEILRVGNTSQGEAVVNLQIPIPYDADSARAGAIALEQATEVSQTEEFSAAIIEAPKLLGIVDVAAGVVTIGVSATVRVSDKDAYVRAVRVAVKSAFDRARAEDAAMDFRPPLVTPPGEAG
jgi:small conductance mechanosensitive channel